MENLIGRLNDFLESEGIKASALARAIGVSAATISQFRGGNYKGDIKEVAKKIQNYIANYKKTDKSRVEKEVFFNTKDAKMVNFIISETIAEREIGLIYGAPGTGKTTILKEWVKNKPNAVLIEATAHTNARSLLNALQKALKLELKGDMDYKLRQIGKFLENDKIVLIDEAEHLPLRALEDLRRLHDFSNAPIVLVGTEILLKNLMGKNEKLSQLFSRICNKHIMEGLSKAECDEYFGEGIYKYTNGGFRSAAKLHKKATRLASLNGSEVNAEIIANASKMIILE